eukprot:scaffold151896_cov38-Attheya_sp.AAC.1
MFNTPLEEWAEKPILSLEEWLHKNKAVIKQCLTNAKKQLKLNGSDIRKFYPSTKDTPVTTHKEARKRKTPPARKLLQQEKLNNHLVQKQMLTPTPLPPRQIYTQDEYTCYAIQTA